MQQHHSNHNTAVSKIVWPKNWTDAHANDGTLPIFLYSVDGVHCRVNEPFHPTLSKNTKMYSHKFILDAMDGMDFQDTCDADVVPDNRDDKKGLKRDHDALVMDSDEDL